MKKSPVIPESGMYAWTMAAGDFFTIHDKKDLRRFLYVVLLIPFDYNIDM